MYRVSRLNVYFLFHSMGNVYQTEMSNYKIPQQLHYVRVKQHSLLGIRIVGHIICADISHAYFSMLTISSPPKKINTIFRTIFSKYLG